MFATRRIRETLDPADYAPWRVRHGQFYDVVDSNGVAVVEGLPRRQAECLVLLRNNASALLDVVEAAYAYVHAARIAPPDVDNKLMALLTDLDAFVSASLHNEKGT